MMQTEGYMIVLKPGALLERYAESYVAQENPGPLQELREAFSRFDIRCYRGISRDPLLAYPSLDQKVIDDFQAAGKDMKSDSKAQRRFREIIGDLPCDPEINEEALASLIDAKEILALTDKPSTWEIIHIARGDNRSVGTFLGYNIGYWGGDHFSLIADTIVVPRWHPPVPDDFTELAEALSCLNESLLFNSSADAEAFRNFYKSKPWAETEYREGEFCVIKVGTPE
jgi:hypothetical protein